MTKIPAFQFYPADWRKDLGVQSLTFHERGIWFEILCLMHEAEARGRLMVNGIPMSNETIARMIGAHKQDIEKTLSRLLELKVAERGAKGELINRRMIRDEELRHIRKEAGKKGGNPNLVNQNPNPPLNQSSEDEDEDEKTGKKVHTRPPSLPTSVDQEINSWLDATAPLLGAKSRQTIASAVKWRDAVKVAVKEQRPLPDWLSVVEKEVSRNKASPQFLSPVTCLKNLQAMNAKGNATQWM